MSVIGMWLLKKSVIGISFGCDHCGCRVSPLASLSGGWQNRSCRLAEEAHESLDVLRYRCQEELLPHELQSPQPQAAQTDLMLEFREQRFHLLSLPLCLGKLGRVRQLPCPLPGCFIHVDGKKAKRSAGALGF